VSLYQIDIRKVMHVIGDAVTWFLLVLAFYIVITPIGLLMRIMGKDPLDKIIDKKIESYWTNKEKRNVNYEKQF